MTLNLAGLTIGHAAIEEFFTGCTVFLCPEGTACGVDVRGPAPGTREIALLGPEKPAKSVNAILLSGGSAFGLAAADGVMRFLAEKGIGHPTPVKPIPLVPAAIVYDLFLGQGQAFPTAETGYNACLNAREANISQGNVGAGTGVTVGKWSGAWGIMKSGFGIASHREGDLVVGAAAVVNAIGDVVDQSGQVLAGARSPQGGWMVDQDPWRRFPEGPPAPGTNTTLVVVFTNAKLSRPQASRLAQRAHDGMAIAIRPVHSTHDGDTAFALATSQIDDATSDEALDLIANIGVEMVAQAIRNSVIYAGSVGPFLGLSENS